jgi:outer membrane protein assembly factor BamB
MTHALLLLVLSAPTHATIWGLVSSDGKVVYLRHDKGFDALDAATGKRLWTAEALVKPLAEAGDVIVSYGRGKGGLRLTGHDRAAGKLKWEKAVPLPERVSVTEGPGRVFIVRTARRAGSLFVYYEAHSFSSGGARPNPVIERLTRRKAAVTLKIDPVTGKCEKLAADKMPAATTTYRNGKVTFTVELEARRLVLRRKVGDKALADVILSDKPDSVFIGMDGKLALVSAGLSGKRVIWHAYDTATGKQAAKFETAASCYSVDAVGGRAFAFTEEKPRTSPFGMFARTLEMIDLKTGKAIWSRKGESVTIHPLPK